MDSEEESGGGGRSLIGAGLRTMKTTEPRGRLVSSLVGTITAFGTEPKTRTHAVFAASPAPTTRLPPPDALSSPAMSATGSMFSSDAHEPGKTCMAFSTDGQFLYTGGVGGLARLWNTRKPDEEPDAIPDVEGALTALAASSTSWFSASDTGEVRRYDKGDREFREFVIQIRGGIEVNGLAVDPRENRIAVAAGDNEIKIVDLDDLLSVKVLKGHTRGDRKSVV